MSAYDPALLEGVMGTMGKAFEFADRHVTGGLDHFMDLFSSSPVARTFEGPDATPRVGTSGIGLVMEVCEGGADAGLELMLMSERRPPRRLRERAAWCGRVLAYHQWATGSTFREIMAYLGCEDLESLFSPDAPLSPQEASAQIALRFGKQGGPTRLRRARDAAGMTQAQLSRESGVSLRSVQQYEQRKKDVNRAQARSLLALAKALGCRMEDLMEPEDEES